MASEELVEEISVEYIPFAVDKVGAFVCAGDDIPIAHTDQPLLVFCCEQVFKLMYRDLQFSHSYYTAIGNTNIKVSLWLRVSGYSKTESYPDKD
eukprot:3268440-Pyramimonas_sp.AAC.1